MFLTGVIDDRFGMRPASKLVFQGLAAAIVVSFGVVYPISPWMPVNVVATILWFIALTNALNLLDNMDGVAAGISAIAALFLAATFGWERQWVLAGVCAAMAGASIGFLRYNWHPASIFMGDSGSLFIGALLAGLGASYPSTASRSIVPILFIPAVIVAIPILDTALVTLTRTLAGRQLSVGGRDHTTHRLVAMGWSQKQAALLLHALAVSGGGVALIAWRSEAAFGLWTIAIFGVILVVLGVYLARLHTYVPDAQPAQPRVTILVSNLLYKRRALEVVLDITLFAVAYYAAYLLRWDGVIPAAQQTILENTLAVAVASQSVAFGLLGVYRGVWQQMTIVDAHRIVKASLLGTVLTVVVIVFAFRDASFARGIFVIQGMLVALLAIAARSSVRSLESVRASLRPAGTRTLIYGSGKAGELLFREIVSDAQLNLRPVGFIDDVGYHTGRLIHGLPVFAGLSQLTEIVERYRVQKIVVASREISKAQRDQLADLCAELHLSLQERDVTLREVSRSEMPPAFQPKNVASGA
jgi:UDP-GlcNAc:undecaprenyl-phosphate GlcNAc-1-phosphate transferase